MFLIVGGLFCLWVGYGWVKPRLFGKATPMQIGASPNTPPHTVSRPSQKLCKWPFQLAPHYIMPSVPDSKQQYVAVVGLVCQ